MLDAGKIFAGSYTQNGFLATQSVVIDFGTKQVRVKGKSVSCMKKEIKEDNNEHGGKVYTAQRVSCGLGKRCQ